MQRRNACNLASLLIDHHHFSLIMREYYGSYLGTLSWKLFISLPYNSQKCTSNSGNHRPIEIHACCLFDLKVALHK